MSKTHRSKSYKRRHSRKHSRRHTHKRGGACPCAMRGQFGGRGAELGHAYSPSYTTGATQELYQMKGITGGSKASKKRRQERLASAIEGSRRLTKKMIANRHNNFKKAFITGMPIHGYEGNQNYLSRNEMKNKIKEEALSEYVRMFGNNEGFNELNIELNNNNNNNMGNIIIPGNNNPYLRKLLRKTKKNY